MYIQSHFDFTGFITNTEPSSEWCGMKSNKIIQGGSKVALRFVSDSEYQEEGFLLNLKQGKIM